MSCTRLLTLLLAGACCAPASAAPLWVPTNFGAGADVDVREESPITNNVNPNELISRVIDNFDPAVDPASDANDRNASIYTRFDLTGASMPGDGQTAFRMSYRNTSLSVSRTQDSVTPDSNVRTGLRVYGLKRTAAGQNWIESGAGGISYLTAPGISFDGNVGTYDFNSDLVELGTVLFPVSANLAEVPPVGGQNRQPVGGSLEFRSAALDAFVSDAIANSASTITLVSVVMHDGKSVFPSWKNFAYAFVPKEMLTLNADPTWDADVQDPLNPVGSPWSAASNAAGRFSPSILVEVIPEPSTAVLAAGMLLRLVVRRRR